MVNEKFQCPNCGMVIEITEAITKSIRDGLRSEVEAESKQKEKELLLKQKELAEKEKQLANQSETLQAELDKRLKAEKEALSQAAYKKAKEEFGTAKETLESELKEKTQKLQDVQKEELKLRKQQKELEERQKNLDLEIQRQLDEQKKKITEDASKAAMQKAQEEFTSKAQDLESQIREKELKLKEANAKELELRKCQRDLEEKQQNLELEVARKIDEERKKIAEEALTKASEQQQLKMREKEDLIKSLQAKMEDLQRKIEVGSQERQGEALEGQLYDTLRQLFPFDEFAEVAKGQRGGDIIQTVRNTNGKICGKILWESKNTSGFNKEWIGKLKQDQQDAGATFAVLMTVTMPKEVKNFDLYNDIWVTDYTSAVGLCTALRQTLMLVAREKLLTVHQDGLKDVIYGYVTGQDFSTRVRTMVAVYKQMQADLESEKRSMLRIWKKREKMIQTVLNNTSEMFGEIEGLLGGQKLLGPIEPLMLEDIASDENEDDVGSAT